MVIKRFLSGRELQARLRMQSLETAKVIFILIFFPFIAHLASLNNIFNGLKIFHVPVKLISHSNFFVQMLCGLRQTIRHLTLTPKRYDFLRVQFLQKL